MIVAVHQPEYLPWPGFFSKMKLVDKFVLLDNVQFEKNYVQNRNILENRSTPGWYTLPIHNLRSQALISEIEINKFNHTFESQINKLQYNYSNAEQLLSEILRILLDSNVNLLETNSSLIEIARKNLEISTEIELASDLCSISNDPTKRIVEIVKSVGGDAYLSGPTGSAYLNESIFQENNIKIYKFKYEIPKEIEISGKFQYSMFHWMLKDHPNLKKILTGSLEA
jgi:hypothetical protein